MKSSLRKPPNSKAIQKMTSLRSGVKLTPMKKLFLYVFLVLMWCNVGFAECIKGDCANGHGTRIFEDGDKYVGEFKNGTFHGKGTYTWTNGYKYVGEFEWSYRSGQGTMTHPDGSTYVGGWKVNKYSGQGTFTWANGDKYVGEFDIYDTATHGTLIYPDGSKQVGKFKELSAVRKQKRTTEKIESVGYNCKVGSKGDEIAFANLKFGENIFETFCRLKQNLKSDNFYVMLSTGDNIYSGTDANQRGQQLSNYIKNVDITKLSNANLIANSINEHFCQKDKMLNSYYQRFVVDLGDDPQKVRLVPSLKGNNTVSFNNYKFEIYPIYVGGVPFNLELNFSNSLGHLLNDDLTLNENVPNVEICIDKSNNTKKIRLQFRLTSIVLYAPTFENLGYYYEKETEETYTKRVRDLANFTETSDKIYRNLTNSLQDKYKIKYVDQDSKIPDTIGKVLYHQFRGLPNNSCFSNDKLFYTSDKISSLIGYQCESHEKEITLVYFSNLVQKDAPLNSAQFLNDMSRVQRFKDAVLNEELNKNKEKDSSGQL